MNEIHNHVFSVINPRQMSRPSSATAEKRKRNADASPQSHTRRSTQASVITKLRKAIEYHSNLSSFYKSERALHIVIVTIDVRIRILTIATTWL